MWVIERKAFGSDCIHSIISRLGASRRIIPGRGRTSGCRAARSQFGNNKEPRPRETTGALVFGVRPPKRRLQYKVELALHERAAIVQHLAESEWLPNRSSFYGVFVAGKCAQSRFLSARRATADSVTAAKRALVKSVGKSASATTDNISKLPKGDETMRTGNGLIVNVRRKRK